MHTGLTWTLVAIRTMREHIIGVKKSIMVLVGFFLLMPIGYFIGNLYLGTFELSTFAKLFVWSLLGGLFVSGWITLNDFSKTNKLIRVFASLELQRFNGTLELVDKYTGWRRKIELIGRTGEQEIVMMPRFEKGTWKQTPFLDIFLGNYPNAIAELRIDKGLTVEQLNETIEKKSY